MQSVINKELHVILEQFGINRTLYFAEIFIMLLKLIGLFIPICPRKMQLLVPYEYFGLNLFFT